MRKSAPSIDIRVAGAGDASAMAAIHAMCFAKGRDAAEIGQFVGVPGCLALLASTASPQPPRGFVIVRSETPIVAFFFWGAAMDEGRRHERTMKRVVSR